MSRANNEEIYIPYGVGICGHVAKTKETINLKDAYEVLRITLIIMILLCIIHFLICRMINDLFISSFYHRMKGSIKKLMLKLATVHIPWFACQCVIMMAR